MSKLLLISDIHAHPFSQFAIIKDGVNSRFTEILDLFDQLEEICKEKKITRFAFLGDIVHTKSKILTVYYSKIYERFAAFAKDKVGLGIVGNHDLGLRAMPEYSSLRPLEQLFHIFDRPGTLKFFNGAVSFLGFPFQEDHKEIRRIIASEYKAANAGYKILVGHCGVDRFKYGQIEYVVKHPLKTGDLKPDWFNRVLFGHYHDFQSLGNVHAVGAICQHNFNDEGKRRGCLVLDTETNKLEFVPLKGPRFLSIDLHSKQELNNLDAKRLKRSYVRCRSFSSEIDDDEIKTFLEKTTKGFRYNAYKEEDFVDVNLFKDIGISDEKLLNKAVSSIVKNPRRAAKIIDLALEYLNQVDQSSISETV